MNKHGQMVVNGLFADTLLPFSWQHEKLGWESQFSAGDSNKSTFQI